LNVHLAKLARNSAWARSVQQFVKSRLNLLDRNDLHRLMPLQLNDLFQECELWTESPQEILSFLGLTIDAADVSQFRDASDAIDRRAANLSLSYPRYYDIAPRTEQLLFLLVRASRPNVVVETGIANGRSTAIILAAMDLNGAGMLHSIDINDDVGEFVPHRHPRWVKHITDGSPVALEGILQGAGPLDIFIHDSDHRYRAQLGEYELAENYGSARFILASDDVNWSYAFLDHCKKERLSSAVLSDINKCFGLARRHHDSSSPHRGQS